MNAQDVKLTITLEGIKQQVKEVEDEEVLTNLRSFIHQQLKRNTK